MKVTIGIPNQGMIHIDTMYRLFYAVLQIADRYEVAFSFPVGTYLHQQRNICVKEARENGSDYLMFIDSDVIPDMDGIEKLLSHNLDIVGGQYHTKSIPTLSTIKISDGKGGYKDDPNFIMPNNVFECEAIPTGFMLIKLKSVEKLNELFDFGKMPDGYLIGEDIWFCREAKKLGLKIYCDPTIKIGHIGRYIY